MAKKDEEKRRRRLLAIWWAPAAACLALALSATAFGFVVAGPVTVGAQPGVVPEPAASPSASPSASPADPTSESTPVPAITAPSPSTDTDTEVFDTPQIKIEPPPPPPKKGVRQTTSTGTSPYLGMTAAQYCALKLPPFPTSGSDPTAFRVAANKERAQTGATAYSWSPGLASTAQSWANTMAANHNAHPELTPGSADWYALVFYHSGSGYAENIAYNYGYPNPVNQAQYGWMLSTGHCQNIMNPSYSNMGAAKAQAADGSWFFVEEFIW